MNSYVKKYDHRQLGEDLNLFQFFPEAPGFPFYQQKGIFLREFLIKEWRRLHQREGYEEVVSPQLMKDDLWEMSGHKELYSDMMFFSSDGESELALKPMSCPGAILYYKRELRSFRDLPFKLCELGHVHRNEPSGSRNGILRARSFVQDDGHIFCSKDQVKGEVSKVLDLAFELIEKFGFKDYHFELSLRDYSGSKNFLGSNSDWIQVEKDLVEIMEEKNLSFEKKMGEAKFYGPSLDLHLKDSNGKSWQCSCIQLDFNLPSRFDCSYVDSGGKKQVPLLIHRALYGSLERFLGILIEHYQGKFPLWLSPIQVRVVPLGPSQYSYGKEVLNFLEKNGIRGELILEEESMGKKIREFYAQKIPYLLILGRNEENGNNVSYRSLSGEEQKGISLNDFIKGDDDNSHQRIWSLYES